MPMTTHRRRSGNGPSPRRSGRYRRRGASSPSSSPTSSAPPRLVDRLDPEDVRALQRAYFDTVAGVLRRWQGVVEKYVGDAVMALFGARHSDGFDAYRAVRAGLEIQAALDRRPLAGGITAAGPGRRRHRRGRGRPGRRPRRRARRGQRRGDHHRRPPAGVRPARRRGALRGHRPGHRRPDRPSARSPPAAGRRQGAAGATSGTPSARRPGAGPARRPADRPPPRAGHRRDQLCAAVRDRTSTLDLPGRPGRQRPQPAAARADPRG